MVNANTRRRRPVTAYFLMIFLPLFALVAGVVTALYLRDDVAATTLTETNERNHVILQRETISSDFRSIVSDLMVLAQGRALRSFFDDPSPSTRQALAEEFRLFSQEKALYDQVRFLDQSGLEIARVNVNDGRPAIVPDQELQSKAGRYYFTQTHRLAPGEVFVSPFDLNIENEVIEQPPKPTIRFGTPILDSRGRARGIMVLNYLGAKLIDKLQKASVHAVGQVMLLNADGYWLHGPADDDEWAFMYPDRVARSFKNRFPAAWQRIFVADSGQFYDDDGMFTFGTVFPIAVAQPLRPPPQAAVAPLASGPARGYDWKIVSHIPRDVLTARTRKLWSGLAQIYAVLAAVLAAGSWLLARKTVQHHRADEALRASEQRFRQLAETIDEVFWMTTADGRNTIYVSPAYERIWGRSADNLYSRRAEWTDAIHPDDRERVERSFADDALRGVTYDCYYRVVRLDGSIRWIWDRAFPIRDDSGAIHRIAGIAEDITALRQAQDQVLQSERLAAIGEAMTGLAHESRNALQRSQACLEMLAKRVRDRPESVDLIHRIQKAQSHLYQLYEEVRGYAAPLELKRQDCDLRSILHEVWEQLATQQAGREVRLDEQSDGIDLSCAADPFAIEQVFRNILENAVAARNAEALPLVINVTWSPAQIGAAPAIRVAIRDNGPGLTPEQSRRIFEPFYTTKVKGTGLGMAISRRIVEAHGGQIAVGDGHGGGAHIVVTLPRRVS